ncbi:MAG: family 1 glycosylhydrolase, partial [Magnetospirillum sp.]|nr:family 1 glycosylhydrolase [Magnetospirillum sp.]
RPMACLYHWDLPQPLEDIGGWQSRAMVGPFADYARIVGERLADRVKDWVMLNEPNVVAIFGYGVGEHAPGHKLREIGTLKALHHQNLAQGAALRALRAAHPGLSLGTVTNVQPARADSDDPAGIAAAARWDAAWNKVTIDGLLKGEWPAVLDAWRDEIVKPGDLDQARFPIDMLGINYYSRMTMCHNPDAMFGAGWGDPHCDRSTFMGWPVQPDGLFDLLADFRDNYGNLPVYIAENGAAYDDRVAADGQVHDAERVEFLQDHIAQVARALEAGCNVKGYLAWSLLDNFEWAFGLSKRFGIVRVDYETGQRTPKDSYNWFAGLIKAARGL